MNSRVQSLDGGIPAGAPRFQNIQSAFAEYSAPRTGLGLHAVDFFMFLIPVLQVVQFTMGGQLFASDILLVAVFPLVVSRQLRWVLQKPIFITILLAASWLFSQVLTDIIRDSQPQDYLRGWSKIALTMTHFAVIWGLLRGSIRRFSIYGFGLVLGGVLSFFISKSEYMLSSPWKFALGLPVTFGVVLLFSLIARRKWKYSAVVALLVMGVVSLFLDFRSMGLVCVAAAGYTYFRMRLASSGRSVRPMQLVIVVVAISASTATFGVFYQHAVKSGWLGEAAQEKYADQQGEGGVLLGGRSELLSSGQAIMDSPIIGHGSWAKDPKYVAIMKDRREALGYKRIHEADDDLIPSHSHLFGAWVESGVLGAIFWMWVLFYVVKTLLRATGKEPLLPVFAFIGFLLCWDILFSPYGAERRFLTTYFIAGIALLHLFTAQTKAIARQGAPLQ